VRLPKDILNTGLYTKPNFFLCQTDKEKICKLETTETKGSFKFNSLSEISFETARVYNDLITGEAKVNPYYDLIEALRLIYVEGFGYFELQGPELISDGIQEKKSCSAYSLEYTLAQKYLENFYINMGTVESIEVINAKSEKDIVPIILYDPSNPKLSLLHLVLEEVYGWKIGHVDLSLRTLSRQFEVDRESVYDFLMNEVCEKFNCYIIFDTINNTINVYAESLTAKFIGDGKTNAFIISPPFAQIGTVSVDGYKTTKWGYQASTGMLVLEDVPEFGAHIEVVDGALTEWETDVFVSFDNLAQEVNINYDADEIKTQLTVTYGDDYDIREVNLGLPYLTDISYYYTKEWMGEDLYDAYTKYMQKSNNSQAEYIKNSEEILKWNDYIAYEENRLSLEYSLVESVNSSTVGTYYIRQKNADGSYYYSEVSLPSEYVVDVDYYSNVTTNVNEEKVGNLHTVLKKYFYAYFNGNADGITGALNELKGLLGFEFVEGYTLLDLYNNLKSANTLAKMDTAVNNFLKELWPELGRIPLQTLYLDPYKTIQQTNIEAGWSNKNDKNYGNYYPTTLLISSIESAIAQRDATIKTYKDKQSIPQKNNAAIGESLLMRNNFTEAQLIKLSAFLREDELHLDDIVETGLEDLSSSFKIKQDAMESGRIELQKISQPRLQFSMTMANIFALSEFDPIINQFQLGRVIRVALRPDYIKQSRLLQVDINFDDFSDFSCEFGELTSLRTQSDIHADLLSNAITAGKSVATNSSYWTRGSDTATSTDLKIQQGLLDATTQIKAIDGTQGVVIDKYGIKLQKKMENGEIDPKQTWLVNNMILMSDDGFKTSRSALGEVTVDGQTYYGLIAEMVLSGYIEGSIMKGGTIQIGEYIDADGNKKYSFEVDKDGNVSMCGGTVQFSSAKNSIDDLEKNIPTKTSQLANDSGYQNETGVVSIIDGTVNADYVKTLGLEVGNQISMGPNAKISWGNVTNQPDIATKSYVTDQGYQTSSQVTEITKDTIKTANITATNLKVDGANITGKLTIGQLPSSVAETSDIPTKTSQLTNDSGYQNSSQVTEITKDTIKTTNVIAANLKVKAANIDGSLTIGQLPSTVAETSDIPTKVSQLNNDSGYQNSTGVVSIAKGAINADHIKTLGLQVGNQISMGPNAKISWSNVTNQPDIATKSYVTGQGYQTSSQVTEITKDTIKTAQITANGAKIGGWTIKDGALYAEGEVYLNPGQEEFNTIKNHLLGSSTIPSNKISLYDFDGSGSITIADMMRCKDIIIGGIEFSTQSNAKKTKVTIKINPSDPVKTICISGTNIWGRQVEVFLGANIDKSTIATKAFVDVSIYDLIENRISPLDTKVTSLENSKGGIDHLWSGTLSSGSCTFTYSTNYKFYIIQGMPESSTALVSQVVPRPMITTSNSRWQIADDTKYTSFYIKYSGSTATLTWAAGYGTINNVFGVK
jgi:hypothetical protein